MRTDFVIMMAFLYDFLTIRKEHNEASLGKWVNAGAIAVSLIISVTFLAGFVEPVTGTSGFPYMVANGQIFLTSLPFNIPYNWIIYGALLFFVIVVTESVLLYMNKRRNRKRPKHTVYPFVLQHTA